MTHCGKLSNPMKTMHVVLVAVGLCGLTSGSLAESGPATARHYYIGVAPGLSSAGGSNIFRACIDFVLYRAQAGDRVEFIEAPQMARLADVTIPPGAARDRAYSRAFSGKFGGLKRFLTEAGGGDPRLAGQLRVPQLLDMVAKGRQPNEITTLVMIGAPLFITTHPTETAFNMEGGLTPGDGMVTCSSSLSLFGTAERKGQLNGVAIHWLTQGDGWATSEMHRSAVVRFWSVFVGEQGATLATISGDTASVFDRVARGENRPVMSVKADPSDTGLIMRLPRAFRRETVQAPPERGMEARTKPVAEAPRTNPAPAPVPVLPPVPGTNRPVVVPAVPLARPPVAKEPEPEPLAKPLEEAAPAGPAVREIPKAATGHIGIAAIWQAPNSSGRDTDIDLYVSAYPGAQEVYWHRLQAPGATYYRDIRAASAGRPSEDWQTSWEYVEVGHADLSKVSLWLNVYEASGPISGFVRVQHGGSVVDRPFRFDVTRGNKGVDNRIEARRRSRYWQEVRLEEMFPETSGQHTTPPNSK
jgi:hypothetical protein